MPRYYNTLPQFGHSGPVEAVSKEALADEMETCFRIWAHDALELAGEQELSDDAFLAKEVSMMRAEFINGLEEVQR